MRTDNQWSIRAMAQMYVYQERESVALYNKAGWVDEMKKIIGTKLNKHMQDRPEWKSGEAFILQQT